MPEKDPIQGPALFPAWYVNEKLEALDQDQLTGLLNQSAFGRAVEERVYEANLGKAQPGLLVLDLDKFKSLNDIYGHLAGDDFLVALAEMLKTSLRHDAPEHPDIARIGGDEFGILLDLTPRYSNYSPEDSIMKVEQRVVASTATLIGLEFNGYKENGLDIAVGWSIWHPGMSAREMIETADKKMYEMKEINRKKFEVLKRDPD